VRLWSSRYTGLCQADWRRYHFWLEAILWPWWNCAGSRRRVLAILYPPLMAAWWSALLPPLSCTCTLTFFWSSSKRAAWSWCHCAETSNGVSPLRLDSLISNPLASRW
jgi:hypothetical protein